MPKIADGERVGNNLFHSLEEFSISEGTKAIFENAPDIKNIFILITGENISFLDGLLQTTGRANFFLINPNGIVFGEKARLDVGSSFIATTGDRLDFADDKALAVRDGNLHGDLTDTFLKKINFKGSNGSINVNGTENQIINKSFLAPIEFGQKPLGLSVSNGQSLSLVGNGLNFNGGVVTTEGGKIYLTSLESGSVAINQAENGLALTNNEVNKYRDINLEQKSLIKSISTEIETISLRGNNINITNGSFILAQSQDNLSSGSINIKASATLKLSGCPPSSNLRSAIRSETLNTGKGANINVFANELIVQDSGRMRTYSFGDGLGGDININISDSSQFSRGSVIATTYGKGNAGNICVSTSQLQLNLAGITSSTFGAGNGGMVDINAHSIKIAGNASANRGSIAATSWAFGNAGTVTVNTSQLQVIEGASLSSSSFASGNAGDLIINASESVEVTGSNQSTKVGNKPQSTIRSAVQSVSPGARKAFKLPDIPTGDSGNLILNTPMLNITRAGVITVENQGKGKAGNLKIVTDTLSLDDGGSITATSASGEDGEIFLSTKNLQIGNNSQITAAGNKNSGKITIDAQYLSR